MDLEQNKKPDQTSEPVDEKVEGTVFKENESKVGPMIGSIIIILIIVIGGIYFWMQRTAVNDIADTKSAVTEEEVEDIESDLDTLDIDSIDTEIEAIEAEFDAL